MSDFDRLPKRDRRGPIAKMAGNSVASNLIMFVILVGGLVFAYKTKQEVFPQFSMDKVSISVALPGSTPVDVEKSIIQPIEAAVKNIDGIKEYTSTASEGSGSVSVELLDGVDAQKVYQDIQAEVDRITTFPPNAEQPSVSLAGHAREVVTLLIYGNAGKDTDRILRDQAEIIQTQLLQSEDISKVSINDSRTMEISIDVPQRNLRKYNLTLQKIADIVSGSSKDVSSGSIKTNSDEILLRFSERKDYAPEFRSIPIIINNDGTKVLLGDIATVRETFEETDRYGLYNGLPCTKLGVYRVGEETPIQVSDAVRKFVKEYPMPTGLKLALQRDGSDIFRARAELLTKNAFMGLALVFVVLGLFLEIRLAFWVAMGIPISFLGAFLIMPQLGMTINMVTMFAFIVSLGIVVDDAIIAGENIYEYRQQGMSYLQASIRGARDVAMPVFFSVLTNIVTFIPLLFIPGVMGKIFSTIPVVVISVFLISLFECIFILPAHLAHQKEKKRTGIFKAIHSVQQKFSYGFRWLVTTYYTAFLDRILKARYITVLVAAAILFLTFAYVKSGRMGFQTFPKVESDYAFVSFSMPEGTPASETQKVIDKLMNAANKIKDENGGDKLVTGIFAEVGAASGPRRSTSGSNAGQIYVYLSEPTVRPIQTNEFVRKWRDLVGEIPGIITLEFQSDRGGPGAGKSLSIELQHTNYKTLELACQDLADTLAEFSKAKDVTNGVQEGKKQYEFKLKQSGLALGLTTNYISQQLRNSFYGAEAIRQQRGTNEIRVMVRLPKSERQSLTGVEELLIRNNAGVEIPLYEAASISPSRSSTSIEHRNGSKAITVTADITPKSDTPEVMKSVVSKVMPDLKNQYPGLTYSFVGHQQNDRESLDSMKVGLTLALFTIFAILAIPFNSFTQPLIVMVSIPFGFVGAVIGHLLMGYSMSIMSVMGLVALSGVVINDSLVLIEYANRKRKEGLNAHDSICTAGVRRFRPILLTTLTTFGGLAPMIFETSRQARFLIPMALSLGYGLLFATLICLLLVPCLYMINDDVQRWVKKSIGWLNDDDTSSKKELANES